MDTKKIVWSEGMFLSPQHFQQQERYFEHFIREYAGQIAPKFYGLSELEIDTALFNVGKIEVRKATGIFPDGTPFTVKEGLVLDIPKNTVNKLVYLALPVARTGAVTVGEDKRLRYSSVEHQVFDVSREQSDPVALDLAVPNVGLKLEGDDLRDYTLLAVALVGEFKVESGVVLNQAFVPNCLQFGVSPYLKDCVADVLAQMQYRANTIAVRIQSESTSKSYQTLMRDYLWLQALSGWLPKLRHWLNDGMLLTRYLYQECISMVGQMQGLEGKLPQSFLDWNTNNLYGIFSKVFSELIILLREVQIDNVTTLRWDTNLFASRRLLRTLIKDRTLYQNGQFVLVVTSSLGAARLSEEFPKTAKLAGNSVIADLVRNALSGVALRNLPYAPSELKSKHDAAYFEVDTQADLWQALIQKDEPIALHIDERIEDINVEFHVIR
ncbi:MAG: type VI secretion system baseplate subunit TssK [Parashewanella sp.]